MADPYVDFQKLCVSLTSKKWQFIAFPRARFHVHDVKKMKQKFQTMFYLDFVTDHIRTAHHRIALEKPLKSVHLFGRHDVIACTDLINFFDKQFDLFCVLTDEVINKLSQLQPVLSFSHLESFKKRLQLLEGSDVILATTPEELGELIVPIEVCIPSLGYASPIKDMHDEPFTLADLLTPLQLNDLFQECWNRGWNFREFL